MGTNSLFHFIFFGGAYSRLTLGNPSWGDQDLGKGGSVWALFVPERLFITLAYQGLVGLKVVSILAAT